MDCPRKGIPAGHPIQALSEIQGKRSRLAIGLMSGTSADGIDVALAQISGPQGAERAKLISFQTFPYAAPMKERILRLGCAGAEEICEMNFILGDLFAECILKFLRGCGLPSRKIDFIGSHGQTVYHLSGHPSRKDSTLQIGEGAVIAAGTGIITVCDFRPADIAHGGTGAPLVPYADFILFAQKGKIRALVNIGGMANVTVVTGNREETIAFDTGPGNAIIDALVRLESNGKKGWDTGGAVARKGTIQPKLLQAWLDLPYFSLAPPKSTGRETFGEDFAKRIWKRRQDVSFEDLMATATSFTAATIYRGFKDFIFPRFSVDEIYLSGGGCHNRTLMKYLDEFFHPIPLHPLAVLGIPGDAKEALAFALLADATIRGLPSNVPQATGARRPAILGKIIL